MWLLQLMQQQHSIDMMKKQGLKLEPGDYEFLTLKKEIKAGATLEQMEYRRKAHRFGELFCNIS